MKNICKIAVLLAAVLMLFCMTGCGDDPGGDQSGNTQTQTPSGGTQTQTPSGGTQTQTPAEPPFVAQETPLTLEAIQAGTITLEHPWSTLKYKKNGGNFVSVTADANTITVAAGDKIAFYADNSENNNGSGYFTIHCSENCYVYGNVMSLLGSNFTNATVIFTDYAFYGLFESNTHIKNHSTKTLVLPATTLKTACYSNMFYGCTSLTSAPALPATTLKTACYKGMFFGCSGLTSAPVLPATTMVSHCYYAMFKNCTNLTSAPNLSATSLESNCYESMFEGCTNLTSAPVLPATTLKTNCYKAMFKGCSSLNTVICLATNISATDCTTNWLKDVASSGTFTKASSMSSWPTNSNLIYNGIPSGWTVVE